jgi:hypothetical protein
VDLTVKWRLLTRRRYYSSVAIFLIFVSEVFAQANAVEFSPDLRTHLYALDRSVIQLEPIQASGGAIEELDTGLVIVTPRGRIATVSREGKLDYLNTTVPMNEAGLYKDGITAHKRFKPRWFRTADIIARQVMGGGVQLFVSHHYYVGGCIEFWVSSMQLAREG